MNSNDRTFTDTAGRRWVINFDYRAIKAVRAAGLPVDLATLMADNLAGLVKLTEDVVTLIDTVYVMVRDQHPEVTDEHFGQSLNGDILGEMHSAFMEALKLFCPPPQRRLLTAIQMVQAKALAKLMMIPDPENHTGETTSGGPESNSEPSPDTELYLKTFRSVNSGGLRKNTTAENGTE